MQARGQQTRDSILRAALEIFGRDGFRQTTTRRIAEAADVSLPSIKYYFESKEGLYLACAREIVSRYEQGVGAFVAQVAEQLDQGMSAGAARTALKQVVRQLSLLSGDDQDARLRTAFVLREMTEQGPAFDVLYRDLWQPGVELTAQLIARIQGKSAPDRESRMEALLLHASMTAMTTTRPVSLRFLGPAKGSAGATSIGDGTSAAEGALAALEAQIDRLGR